MKNKVLHIITLAILIFCAGLFSFQFGKCLWFVSKHIHSFVWFFAGGIVYYIVMCKLLHKNLVFFQTGIHEFLHIVVCIMCFRKIESSYASANKGGAVHYQGDSNIFITLAPYTFPAFTYILLLLALLIPKQIQWFAIFIGFTFFMHLHAFIKQLHPSQPDLKKYGLLTSYSFIITFLCLNSSICLYGTKMDLWKGILYFFNDSYAIIHYIF